MIPKIIHQIWYQDTTFNYSKVSNKIESNYNRIIKSQIPFAMKYDMLTIISNKQLPNSSVLEKVVEEEDSSEPQIPKSD